MPNLTGRLQIYPDGEFVGRAAARLVAGWVGAHPGEALGLATGQTMVPFLHSLADIHQQDKLVKPVAEQLSFRHTPCFNLDDYRQPIASPQSYSRFMAKHFYNKVDCPKKLRLIPYAGPGTEGLIATEAAVFEAQIKEARGIGLQLLGLGPLENDDGPIRGGHIGFNEAGSDPLSRTRLVELAASTRRGAVKEFGSLDRVPTQAVTMGVGTIMEARQILILITGLHKARIARYSLENEPTPDITATILHKHPNVLWCLDEAAASLLPPAIMAQAIRHARHGLLGGGSGARKLASLGPA